MKVVVLRPEPGNAATAARLSTAGFEAIRQPVFETRALAWTAPIPEEFDALLVTSAQAVRLAGPALAQLAHLPVVAVGHRTAAAAREAGLGVAISGEHDAADAMARANAAGFTRLLHLAGRDRTESTAAIEAVTVYESVQTRAPDIPPGAIVLLHSARAAQALATSATRRETTNIVAISPAVLAAAGAGWRIARAAAAPTDAAMIAAARAIDPPLPNGDDAA